MAPVDLKPEELTDLLKSRWEQVPERVESYVAALNAHPYGRLVIHRFPRMLQLRVTLPAPALTTGRPC